MLTFKPFHRHTIRDEFKENLAHLLNCFSEHRLRRFLQNNGFSLNEKSTIRFPSEMVPFNSTRQLKMVWDNPKTKERIISPIFNSEIVYSRKENDRNPFTVRCYKEAAVDLWLRRNRVFRFQGDRHFPQNFDTPQERIPKLSLLYFFKAFYDNRLSSRYLAYLLGFEQTMGNANMLEYTYTPDAYPHTVLNRENNQFPIRIYRKLYDSPCDELMLICHFWRRVISHDSPEVIDVLKIRP